MNNMTFVWDDCFWTSKAKLRAWAGFKNFKAGSRRPSDGTVQIVFAPEGRGEGELTGEELRLIDQFVKTEADFEIRIGSSGEGISQPPISIRLFGSRKKSNNARHPLASRSSGVSMPAYS